MIVCVCCNKQFKRVNVITNHIRRHGYSAKVYYDTYIKKDKEENCCICGKETRFVSISKGYLSTCCQSCNTKKQWWDEKRKDEHRKRFNPLIGNGRPKGSKNKNKYPMTDAVLLRIKNMTVRAGSEKNIQQRQKKKCLILVFKSLRMVNLNHQHLV